MACTVTQVTTLLVFFLLLVPNLYAENPKRNFSFPSYDDAVKTHCELNRFDCMKSGALSVHALDILLKSLYQESEQIAVDAGFELASFEYCQYNPGSCYVNVNQISEKKIRRLHKQIKGSPFQITPIYPSKDNWWRASNGERYQSSSKIAFYKEITSEKVNKICTIEQVPGNKLRGKISKAIRKNPKINFGELISASKGSRAFLRVKAPSLLSKEYISKFNLVFECLLTSSAGLTDKNKTIFRSKLKTEKDFHFTLNEIPL